VEETTRCHDGGVEATPGAGVQRPEGEDLARVTNGIVRLFREYYGRGPTSAKSYLLGDRYLVCVLKGTMTVVEQTLVGNGHHDMVRTVRLRFQEAMRESFIEAVEQGLGRKVEGYHSQATLEPDLGFEFFALAPQ
jgi:uncharacterized protein YbcI